LKSRTVGVTLCMEKNTTEQFCRDLLQIRLPRRRALVNYVMGLCSGDGINSAVSICESRHCHYTHSNLGKIVEDLSSNAEELTLATTEVQSFLGKYIPPPRESGDMKYYVFQTDVTKVVKPHSVTMEGRQYVPISNQKVPGNKAIDIGCRISMTHLHAEPGWPLPLQSTLLGVEDDAIALAVSQTKALLESPDLPFGNHLCIQEADSTYGQAAYLSPLYVLPNLVCIARLRAGIRIWLGPKKTETGGAPQIYGEKYYLSGQTQTKTYKQKPSKKHPEGFSSTVLQCSIMDVPYDERVERQITLSNNRPVNLTLIRWNGLKIRSKNGHNMKDKPFDLVRVEARDARTGKLIFERPMFIAISGQLKGNIQTTFAQERYRERYDVEPYYLFAKKQLLLEKFQTPIREHLSNFMFVVTLSTWLLFCARNECKLQYKPWQKQLPKNKAVEAKEGINLSIAQTRMSIGNLFDTFDPAPFLPQNHKKGKGREKGTILIKRAIQPVLKKAKKVPKIVKKE
jgi:hypothetical protein